MNCYSRIEPFRVFYFILALPLLLSAIAAAGNQAPFVSNVVVKQIDIDHILIRYDVADPDGDRLKISLRVSDDGGKTFNVPATKLEGDVGRDISSGIGNEIVWTIDDDIPLHKLGENYVIGVVADDLAGFSDRIIWGKDGAEMALIPAGFFEMGSDNGRDNEKPVHMVELEAFYMDVNEVTVGQFKRFAEESGYAYDRWNSVAKYSPTDEHPMVEVTWNDATAYAQWADKRLPTEAEWEYVARGGLSGKRYPWGDDKSVARDHANYLGTGGKDQWGGPPNGGTAPVGSFDSNGYGLYDMTGNVWEWCADWYGENYYTSPLKNPKGPDTGQYRVLRGGAWSFNTSYLRAAYRTYSSPSDRSSSTGFRCMSGAPLSLAGNQRVIEWEKDEAEMVLIPAGSFEMGDHLDNRPDALPVHTVELEAFYMDVNEVTVGQFKRFAGESGYAYNRWNSVAKYSPTDEHPMIYVSWDDATAYAQWASKRLPTEAEWEYVARGGLTGKRYPWGDDESVARNHANYSGTGGKDQWEGFPNGGTAPVGSFDYNGYGLYDMAGNVREWCADRYDANYYTNSPLNNPKGPTTGQSRVLRGGTWFFDAGILRAAYRTYSSPGERNSSTGFRCVSGASVPLAGNQGVIEWEKGGSKMVLIPAGSFEMGDHLDNMGNALPVHIVELEAFYMDIYEVTVGQFKRFAEESGYAYNRWNDVAKYSPTDEHPMVYISWNDATAYTQWAGKRLPAEAEWEYAARGGLTGKRYPWGDDESVARNHANYSGTGGKDQWEGPPNGGTAPVGSFDSNGYGLYDMAGNVWEYCADWYGENYYTNSPLKNPKGPKGPDTGQFWVLRGGAWNSLTKHLRAAYRLNNYPTTRRYDSGFRCVSGLN